MPLMLVSHAYCLPAKKVRGEQKALRKELVPQLLCKGASAISFACFKRVARAKQAACLALPHHRWRLERWKLQKCMSGRGALSPKGRNISGGGGARTLLPKRPSLEVATLFSTKAQINLLPQWPGACGQAAQPKLTSLQQGGVTLLAERAAARHFADKVVGNSAAAILPKLCMSGRALHALSLSACTSKFGASHALSAAASCPQRGGGGQCPRGPCLQPALLSPA